MYSKEIQLAQIDLNIAMGAQSRVSGGLGVQTIEGAIQRLRNLAVPESRIEEVRTKGANPRTLDWMSPATGTVIEKRIVNGQRVMPGEELYRIADLSRMWVIAEVSELDLAAIKVGMHADVVLRAYASQPLAGVVTFIYPDLRPETRTARVRIELPNPDGRLKVDMYADVVFRTGADRDPVVAVPVSAVIDSGTQQIVLVDKGEGRFEPREIKLGAYGQDYVEVLKGVKEGELVVTTATFLIDSESNLTRRAQELRAPGRAAMIAAIIRWSARNIFLVGLATVFVTLAGIYAVYRVPLDAIPDLSDVQVIIYTEYPGQAPQVVEDQVTYPLTTSMLSVPKSRNVRGFSFFGVSFVYVIFEDGTDLYWARSRVLEYLNSAARRLPSGVAPSLGPDATGVGWVYQYIVRGAQMNLAELRTIQDWYIRYGVAKAEGVAEVASVGGFVKQYSVVIDPRRLQALGIPLAKVNEAIRTSNRDVGGRTVELSETEFAIRGRGYVKGLSDLQQIVVKSDRGVPVFLRDVARVELTPDERRGITEVNGEGEVVTGIALQRSGENALTVIRNVKKPAGRARLEPARRRFGRSRVRPLRPDLSRDRHAEDHADRGERHRRARLRDLPLACAQRVRRHHHAANRRADRLSPHVHAGAQFEHHEPGRHRNRDRSDGRRRHRDDRERAQAP